MEEIAVALVTAIAENNTPLARQILTFYPDFVGVKSNKFSTLAIASQLGHDESVELLLSYNADIEIGHDDRSPLMIAVQKNHPTTCSILLWRGASTCCFDKYGFTPLLQAIEKDFYEIVELLVSHNANLDQPRLNKTFPPLMSASILEEKFC